ncbi:hypothetical protein TTHERM_00775990 (macronuclear) [Tetrahymena thermophila SB210]|uniref:Uncharacterized protein n=1 Tax=Tetrahymena thermophila (strain SB210) TaxID=312017 RepID=Q23WV7_TETTS|nr:hypothetical protein TTHERM_00775990 [Tetrahymena thermophila SB210]EAS00988.2 hypothetical protein TTHERM_00775990 [Tetrahymena thermophila SB210]|eukprot:XP_001021233.2 hypothetical protein TTHERM_00775990 [Tetrahymena thermophila SB210]
MDNLQMQSSQVLQNLLNILGATQHVEAKDQNGLNFQITSKNQCIEVQFEGSLQTYLFSQTGFQLEYENQSNFVIFKNSQLFSLATILHYFYIKHITQQSPIQSKSDFVSLCNHFMTALGQNRVFSNIYIIWSQWKTYWSTNNISSYCYSNCSGQCNQKTCAGGQCLYYFPAKELNNPQLPEQERNDPNNRFDDQLFYLASIFDSFIKEEKKQFDNFFFSFQNVEVSIFLRNNEKTLDIIQVQLLQGNVIKLKSLQQLYSIDKNQIKSISILSLDEQFIPKGEQQRKQLYDFILSLQNLNSLEIQLEAGIYHVNEEKVQISRAVKQFIPVPKEVVDNFVSFLLQIKVEKLSLTLDEFCYGAAIDLKPIFDCLPNINHNLKTLQISVARRRMHEAQQILQTLCKLQQLEVLNLRIKQQWASYHCSTGKIDENFQKWEDQLRNSIKNIQQLQID